MARTPRATVSKTSGQGISRLSYQKGYKLKGGAGIKGPGKSDMDAPRDYGKGGKAKSSRGGSFNVSYGDTFKPTDLKEIGEMYTEQPMKLK